MNSGHISQTFLSFSVQFILNSLNLACEGSVSPLVFLDLPFLIIHQLFHFPDDTLISTTFSPLLLDFILQESNRFFIFLLFFSVHCNLSIKLVGQLHLLIKHFLHLLKFPLINQTFPSLLLNGILYVMNLIIVFHSDPVIFQELFLLFLHQSLILSDGCLISQTLLSLLIQLFFYHVQLFLVF